MTEKQEGGLMQGNNTLSLCPATMQKVVQAWLDAELASPVTVKSVKHSGTTDRFEISFDRIAARTGGDA